jgi:hypothetical protein
MDASNQFSLTLTKSLNFWMQGDKGGLFFGCVSLGHPKEMIA